MQRPEDLTNSTIATHSRNSVATSSSSNATATATTNVAQIQPARAPKTTPGSNHDRPLQIGDLQPRTPPTQPLDTGKLGPVGANDNQEVADPAYAKEIAEAFCGKSPDEIAQALVREGFPVQISKPQKKGTSGKAIMIDVKPEQGKKLANNQISQIEYHPGGGTAHSFGGDDETGRYYRITLFNDGKVKVVDKRYKNDLREKSKIIWVDGLGQAMPMQGFPEPNKPITYKVQSQGSSQAPVETTATASPTNSTPSNSSASTGTVNKDELDEKRQQSL